MADRLRLRGDDHSATAAEWDLRRFYCVLLEKVPWSETEALLPVRLMPDSGDFREVVRPLDPRPHGPFPHPYDL